MISYDDKGPGHGKCKQFQNNRVFEGKILPKLDQETWLFQSHLDDFVDKNWTILEYIRPYDTILDHIGQILTILDRV